MAMTREDAYMIGFLQRCVAEGLSEHQTQNRVKQALFGVGTAVRGLTDLGGAAAALGLGGAIGLTGLAGYHGGKLLGGIQSDPLGEEEVQTQDMVKLYNHLRLKAEQERKLRERQLI